MIRHLLVTSLVALVLAPARAGAAEVLTCEAFEARLDETITAMGEHVAHPGPMRLVYGGEADRKFDWSGIVGLAGSVTCSKADAFEDFSIAIPEAYRTSDDLPTALKRFMELASASVCTLAEGQPEACRALVKTMTDATLADFRTAVAKGEAVPSGSRDFYIVDGVDAEIDMTPVDISWSIGPGLAMTTGAAKQRLSPRNMDK